MKIQFDKNINLFKNKSNAQIIKSIPSYKKYYKQIFISLINELNFDDKLIDCIHIVHDKKSYGTTTPFIDGDKLLFLIEFSDDVILYLSTSTPNSLEAFKSKSIFQHEICHCIEINHLYNTKDINMDIIFDNTIKLNSTYKFILHESIIIWSEFFACYTNCKFNEWHEIPNGEEDIIQLIKWIEVTKRCLDIDNDVKLHKDMIAFLHKFWYNMVSMIAIHLHNNEDVIVDDYRNSTNQYIREYFNYIYNIFKIHINHYPEWISESNYISLGKSLMKILEINGITYSTEDLSDNFIFIKK